MLSGLSYWLAKARKEKFALGAFNVGGWEFLKAISQAAKNLNFPVIVEVSSGEEKHLGMQNLLSLVNNVKEELGVEIFLNLDHAEDIEKIKIAIDKGFDLIHFDGSRLPYEENLRLTAEIVKLAHGRGVLVEGEIDHIPGSSQRHGEKGVREESGYTNPQKAREFVEKTGIDLLAVSVGNAHGVYSEEQKLDVTRMAAIAAELPDTFFSLHGGSGVAPEDITAVIRQGVVKVNVNTEMRLVYRETLENVLRGNPDEAAMYKLLPPVVEAVERVVEAKMLLFRA